MTFSDWQIAWIQDELIEVIGNAIVEEMSDTSALHSTHSQTISDFVIRGCVDNAVRRAVRKETLNHEQ